MKGDIYWTRAIHRWLSVVVAAPLLLVMVTGIALQLRKPSETLQPGTASGAASYAPAVTAGRLLEVAQREPAMRVDGWRDILLTDYRPKKGVVKVRNSQHFEVQVDALTGEVLKSGQRLNDYLSKIHDGSAFGLRLWLFPARQILRYSETSESLRYSWLGRYVNSRCRHP